ncbi:hypothetical protein [Asticcacaulis sp. AND118]|uniref:hypothetical protein n=1 Tax=Asticcacaulis sp. AND118 TaxID=2840468 RepID=UPI001CFFE1A7|nr:hypothetical protein [Asticcacaulis sp. AND118]UDF05223.1 hypothetical protein LH365_17690 [Asticcacaulis sp. AND118]
MIRSVFIRLRMFLVAFAALMAISAAGPVFAQVTYTQSEIEEQAAVVQTAWEAYLAAESEFLSFDYSSKVAEAYSDYQQALSGCVASDPHENTDCREGHLLDYNQALNNIDSEWSGLYFAVQDASGAHGVEVALLNYMQQNAA